MNDIDYDELDKAMSELANKTPNTDETKINAAPVTQSQPVSQPQNRPIPSLSERRGGRFMDMVNPGAARSVNPTPANPVSDVTMPSRPRLDNNRPNGPLISSIKPAVSQDMTVKPSLEPPKSEFELNPDNAVKPVVSPLMGGFGATTPSIVSPTVPAPSSDDDMDDIDKISAELEKDLNGGEAKKPEEEPAKSLFLPDAKVEKRPLGAFSAMQEAQPAIAPEEAASDVSNPVDSDPLNMTESDKAPLPDELNSDILSVESNSVAHAPEASMASDNKPVENIQSAKDVAPQPVNLAESLDDKSKDQSGTAMYDHVTATNQALLKQSAKKKGGVIKVILWVLLLIILGVGSGAAVYFLILPNL